MVAFICNFMVRSRLFYVTLQTNERPLVGGLLTQSGHTHCCTKLQWNRKYGFNDLLLLDVIVARGR
jgi:hypothetical protein